MSDDNNIGIYVLGNQVTKGTLGNGAEKLCQTMGISACMFWVTR